MTAPIAAPAQTFEEWQRESRKERIQKGGKSCVWCMWFDQKGELCTLGKLNQRPPARVIAFGCPRFEDDIPF